VCVRISRKGALVATPSPDADSQRSNVLGLQEAWIGWNPVPQSAWRTRVKVGAFFPTTSLEVAYDSIDWSATRTISAAAINSWIGEEIRIAGVELTQQWRGAMIESPHTFTARLGIFGMNDPAGTQIAWRGWNVGGRNTDLLQTLRLPDLPVYRPGGPLQSQARNVQLFREIDERPGVYVALGYGYDEWLEGAALHYDNRGDPLRLQHGQYSWHTRFDHLSLRAQPAADWELLAQWLRGNTLMGPNAVNVDFSSWYLLLSHQLGPGLATIRHDQFRSVDHDTLPTDANGESGHAWTFAYNLPLANSFTLVAELLSVDSQRTARATIGASAHKAERSLTMQLRRSF
jgi:hypothetical protein